MHASVVCEHLTDLRVVPVEQVGAFEEGLSAVGQSYGKERRSGDSSFCFVLSDNCRELLVVADEHELVDVGLAVGVG